MPGNSGGMSPKPLKPPRPGEDAEQVEETRAPGDRGQRQIMAGNPRRDQPEQKGCAAGDRSDPRRGRPEAAIRPERLIQAVV